jgi:microcompartment protein CcmL/EutN
MQALGLIETKGLLVAIESADAMLKSADVTLLEKAYVGGGLVSIIVTGEVAAVQAAVDAGVAAVCQVNRSLLISQHVIPRPQDEVASLIGVTKPVVPIHTFESVITEPIMQVAFSDVVVEEIKATPLEVDSIEIMKNTIDQMVVAHGVEKALEFLGKLKVTKLRNLAREYKKLKIAGRMISKADKKTLLDEIHEYYTNNPINN